VELEEVEGPPPSGLFMTMWRPQEEGKSFGAQKKYFWRQNCDFSPAIFITKL